LFPYRRGYVHVFFFILNYSYNSYIIKGDSLYILETVATKKSMVSNEDLNNAISLFILH